jgi:hypothetical protein
MKDNINFYSNPMDYTPTEEEIEEELTRDFEWELYKIERHRLNQERWNRETTIEKNQTVDGGNESNTSMEIDLN